MTMHIFVNNYSLMTLMDLFTYVYDGKISICYVKNDSVLITSSC